MRGMRRAILQGRFAAHAAQTLERLAGGGWAAAVVVVAPPKALGEMRKHYGHAVKAALAGEINKDLTMLAVPEIAAALARA